MRNARPRPAPAAVDLATLARATLPGLLAERVRRTPDQVAYRAKELGVYRETSWRQLGERVTAVALGLCERGLQPGDTVAIMGHACPEWTIADLAIQAAGGVTVGVYPTVAASELAYLLRHSGARFMVAEDQEHLDRALSVWSDSPELRAVFVIDTRALFMYRDDRVVSFTELEAEGSARATPDALEELAATVQPEDPATIVYTSGTTGPPKGAVLRHGRHIAAAANMLGHYPELVDVEHRVVAFLPLSHVMGRNATITLPLLIDLVPHYPEDVEGFAEALFDVSPTFLFTVPRYLQKFASALLVGLEHTSPVKRAAYHLAMRIARAHLRARWAGRASLLGGAAAALAQGLVFRWLLDKVGFARLQVVLCSGAPLPPEVAALWQLWGVNVLEAYGQTEAGGAILTGQRGVRPRPGDVGLAAPGVELRLADDGEVLARSPYFFAGYFKDPAATAAVVRDGWLATGDVGEWTPDGALRLVDRKKDLLITAGGKNVSPSSIESRLRASPYVSEATVLGEGRKYLVALIEADYDAVAEWARAHGVPYTGYTSLVTRPEVIALVGDAVERANVDLARVEQVKAFRLLPRELDPEQDGEPVTPTRKIKRRLLAEHFGDLVEAMYSDDEARKIIAATGGLDTVSHP
jgi:long-chain acyl-CoA synthetase